MDNMKLLLYVFYYYHILSYSSGSIFFMNVYIVLFLFHNVIYVFLLLGLYMFVLFYVLFVFCRSVYCLCVYVYCTSATGWLPNCS